MWWPCPIGHKAPVPVDPQAARLRAACIFPVCCPVDCAGVPKACVRPCNERLPVPFLSDVTDGSAHQERCAIGRHTFTYCQPTETQHPVGVYLVAPGHPISGRSHRRQPDSGSKDGWLVSKHQPKAHHGRATSPLRIVIAGNEVAGIAVLNQPHTPLISPKLLTQWLHHR